MLILQLALIFNVRLSHPLSVSPLPNLMAAFHKTEHKHRRLHIQGSEQPSSFVPLTAMFTRFRLCRDHNPKLSWANSVISEDWNIGLGGIGGMIFKRSVGWVFW
jgi:hypothetical protein